MLSEIAQSAVARSTIMYGAAGCLGSAARLCIVLLGTQVTAA